MLADDELLRACGTPCDLSCCGIELQAQIAVHGFPIFRTAARFSPTRACILWFLLEVFVVFSNYFFPLGRISSPF